MRSILSLCLICFLAGCGSDDKESKPQPTPTNNGEELNSGDTVRGDGSDQQPAEGLQFTGEEYCAKDGIVTVDVDSYQLCVKEPARMIYGPNKNNSIEFAVVDKSTMNKVNLRQLNVQPWMKHCCGVRPVQDDLKVSQQDLVYEASGLYFNKPSYHKWVIVLTFVNGEQGKVEFEVEIPFVDR